MKNKVQNFGEKWAFQRRGTMIDATKRNTAQHKEKMGRRDGGEAAFNRGSHFYLTFHRNLHPA